VTVSEFRWCTAGFEYQMLYGIRDGEQRRLAERPANLTFFLRALLER